MTAEIADLKSALQKQCEEIANINKENILLKQITKEQESLIHSVVDKNRNLKRALKRQEEFVRDIDKKINSQSCCW